MLKIGPNSQIVGSTLETFARAYDEDLAKRCAQTLLAHYPGYIWRVAIPTNGGVIQIWNESASHTHGYTLHYNTTLTDPQLKSVVRAGGHICEAYNLRRSRASEAEIGDIPEDFAGRTRALAGSLVEGARYV